MMIRVICMVKATRSQKPAPNHWAVSVTELPTDRLARNTMPTATTARTKGSGNHRSNQSDRPRPMRASQESGVLSGRLIGARCYQMAAGAPSRRPSDFW